MKMAQYNSESTPQSNEVSTTEKPQTEMGYQIPPKMTDYQMFYPPPPSMNDCMYYKPKTLEGPKDYTINIPGGTKDKGKKRKKQIKKPIVTQSQKNVVQPPMLGQEVMHAIYKQYWKTDEDDMNMYRYIASRVGAGTRVTGNKIAGYLASRVILLSPDTMKYYDVYRPSFRHNGVLTGYRLNKSIVRVHEMIISDSCELCGKRLDPCAGDAVQTDFCKHVIHKNHLMCPELLNTTWNSYNPSLPFEAQFPSLGPCPICSVNVVRVMDYRLLAL